MKAAMMMMMMMLMMVRWIKTKSFLIETESDMKSGVPADEANTDYSEGRHI